MARLKLERGNWKSHPDWLIEARQLAAGFKHDNYEDMTAWLASALCNIEGQKVLRAADRYAYTGCGSTAYCYLSI
jgi:hypothetical protein